MVDKNKVLGIIETDDTFKPMEHNGEKVWQGKCIFCNKKIYVSESGQPYNNVSIEHIIPRSKGGTEDIQNLALACVSCNNEKGIRHDTKKSNKARAKEIITMLQNKRMERWKKK